MSGRHFCGACTLKAFSADAQEVALAVAAMRARGLAEESEEVQALLRLHAVRLEGLNHVFAGVAGELLQHRQVLVQFFQQTEQFLARYLVSTPAPESKGDAERQRQELVRILNTAMRNTYQQLQQACQPLRSMFDAGVRGLGTLVSMRPHVHRPDGTIEWKDEEKT